MFGLIQSVARSTAALNDRVLVCNEDLLPHPDRVTDIEIREPLRAWLAQRTPVS